MDNLRVLHIGRGNLRVTSQLRLQHAHQAIGWVRLVEGVVLLASGKLILGRLVRRLRRVGELSDSASTCASVGIGIQKLHNCLRNWLSISIQNAAGEATNDMLYEPAAQPCGVPLTAKR